MDIVWPKTKLKEWSEIILFILSSPRWREERETDLVWGRQRREATLQSTGDSRHETLSLRGFMTREGFKIRGEKGSSFGPHPLAAKLNLNYWFSQTPKDNNILFYFAFDITFQKKPKNSQKVSKSFIGELINIILVYHYYYLPEGVQFFHSAKWI